MDAPVLELSTPGTHTVVVRATDGLGQSTSKTMSVKVGDATKPNLEVGGELFAAPEGWIHEEEGNYGLHASATDSGFGVTSLVFDIDGKSGHVQNAELPRRRLYGGHLDRGECPLIDRRSASRRSRRDGRGR